ncbi:hypothetical protein NP493_1607g00027 [Ridgeia piscesae]|uniref:C3H1-type domain-containing protein n=1 Tax=Ridgeia piscesae TaxID=27915 RepID=A0AAD9JYK3_RIDPI|nr:hypothetical protein NP493_1607g00027 [Ridgeia piscesae]
MAFCVSYCNNGSSFVLVSLLTPVCSSMCVDVPHPDLSTVPVTVSPTGSHTPSLCTPSMITVSSVTAYHMLGPCCHVVNMSHHWVLLYYSSNSVITTKPPAQAAKPLAPVVTKPSASVTKPPTPVTSKLQQTTAAPASPAKSASSAKVSGTTKPPVKVTGPVNGNECYFWRTTGCSFGKNCHNKHIPSHKGIDKKPWHMK